MGTQGMLSRGLSTGALGEQDLDSPDAIPLLREVSTVEEAAEEEDVRWGFKPGTITVQFSGLTVQAPVSSAARAVPSILNYYLSLGEAGLRALRVMAEDTRQHTILDGVSGVIRPGRLTLLLGPPASGKSTLLKALCGKLDPKLEVEGRVTYNGYGLDEFVVPRTAAYVEQVDNHIAELTVRETLQFAARSTGATPGELADLQGLKDDEDVHAHLTDYILRMLGLEICADTNIGSGLVRGISGGQRKRVTTGEMLIRGCRAVFLDEPSTGLDSTTTFQIVQAIKQLCHKQEMTILMSLLQPPPETYDLFDDVMLISDGQIVFHGPREGVIPFFESLGFRCPERKGTADFLQEITSRKDQQQYWVGEEPYRYISSAEIAAEYTLWARPQLLCSGPEPTVFERTTEGKEALAAEPYALSWRDSIRVSLGREATIMDRYRFVFLFRIIQIVIICVGCLLLFRNNPAETLQDGQQYLGFIYYTTSLIMGNAFSEVTIQVGNLGVFFKQRDNMFFPVSAFTVPTSILRVPVSAMAALTWSCITYFALNTDPDPARFFVFLLLLFLQHQMALTLFRFCAALGRNMVRANIISFYVIITTQTLPGYLIRPSLIHPWWIWFYWIDPLTYTFRGLAATELTSRRWSTPLPPLPGDPPGSPPMTVGEAVLARYDISPSLIWPAIAVAVNLFYILLFNILVAVALRYLPDGITRENTVIAVVDEEEDDISDSGDISVKVVASPIKGAPQQSKGCGRSSVGPADSASELREPLLDSAMEEGKAGRGMRRVASHGMILPFSPITVTFEDVRYFVPMPEPMARQIVESTGGPAPAELELLKGVTGAFRPAVLTALMGATGAGKTTFMDVLSCRKTSGRWTGAIKVNGWPQQHRTFARVSGYAEQADVHSPHVLVREALLFSARLRLGPEVDSAALQRFVGEVMDLVELNAIAQAIVGIEGQNGLSVEQRKRLTIAVELVANPSVVFMDEPTSGLDARAAAIVMRAVRNIADTGRTIVCTIHQPAIDIFEAFDELLLLKRGGEVIYNGPLGHQSSLMIAYFKSIPGIPDIAPGYNPATWMLDISSPRAEEALGDDLAVRYALSGLHSENKALVAELSIPPPGSAPLAFTTAFPQPLLAQYRALLAKNLVAYWRNPTYNASRFSFTVGFAILFGSIFYGTGATGTSSLENVFAVAGAQYLALLLLGFTNANTVMPHIAIERPVFYREKAAGLYAVLPYAVAQGTVELPYCTFQALVYGIITYFLIGFPPTPDKFFWYLLLLLLTLLYFTSYGIMAVNLSPNIQVSAVVSTVFYSMWNLFSGFLIPSLQMPWYLRWAYYLDPLSWTIHGLVETQLGDVQTLITTPDGGTQTVALYLRTYFGFRYEWRGYIVAVLVGFLLAFRLGSIVALHRFHFQKR